MSFHEICTRELEPFPLNYTMGNYEIVAGAQWQGTVEGGTLPSNFVHMILASS